MRRSHSPLLPLLLAAALPAPAFRLALGDDRRAFLGAGPRQMLGHVVGGAGRLEPVNPVTDRITAIASPLDLDTHLFRCGFGIAHDVRRVRFQS